MSILLFALRRLVVTAPVVFGVCFAAFMLVRIGGGDPAAAIAGPLASQDEIQRQRVALGLDQSIFVQFGRYVGRLLQGDMGVSWQSGEPVSTEIAQRLPATLELVLVALLIAILVAVPIGLRCAMNRGGSLDRIAGVLSSVVYSAPTFWLALIAIYYFFFRLGVAPPPMGRFPLELLPPPHVTGSYLVDGLIAGDGEVVLAQLKHLWLPASCLSLGVAAPLLKQTRAIALGVVGSDYIRLGRAYGLPRRIIARMVLRNSLTPIITFVGSELTGLLAAAALIELIFSWGGFGQWGLNAILSGDYAAVQGYVLVLSLFSILVFLLIDVMVLVSEPRAANR